MYCYKWYISLITAVSFLSENWRDSNQMHMYDQYSLSTEQTSVCNHYGRNYVAMEKNYEGIYNIVTRDCMKS